MTSSAPLCHLCDWLFWQALTDYRVELRDDPIISTHLAKLYDNLLEQNLIRVIEPFSRVQVRTLLGLEPFSGVRGSWLGILTAPPPLPSRIGTRFRFRSVPGGQEAPRSLGFSKHGNCS